MKSIRTKILVMVGGVAILAMVISAVITIDTVFKTVVVDEKNISGLSAENVTAQLDTNFERYIYIVRSMAADGSVRKFLTGVTQREGFTQHPSYQDVYMTLGGIPELDSQNILMAYVASGKTDLAFDATGWVCDPGFDITTRSYWFSDNNDIERGYIITEPYQDLASGGMVITIAAPVYDIANANIVGVAAIDVSISNLSEMVVSSETSYDSDKSESMLISGQNIILACENSSYILKNVDDIGMSSEIIDQINQNTGEVVKFEKEDIKYYGVIKETENVEWKVMLAVEEDEFMNNAAVTRRNTILVYAVAIAILILAVVVVAKNIVAPLRKLNAITQELAEGNLEADIGVSSNDETGELADSMRKLVIRLSEYIDYIEEISYALGEFSEGKLNISLAHSYEGDFEKVKNALMQVSAVFKGTIGQIVETSERVASGSGEISNAAQMLAEGATHQASTTQELNATINELSQRVTRNAEHAMNASAQVKIVGGTADESNEQMKEMIAAIDEINDKSSEIGKIIKVIEDIAFQTNILALNAAVEAARAGEAGKGFAVVADEVRNLASKSAEAAKDTTRLIEETIRAVENGTVIANMTGEKLAQVIDGVAQTVNLIDEISSESAEQANALKQTLEGVEQISSVVQTNAATAEESSAASDELSKQANALNDVAARFKLD